MRNCSLPLLLVVTLASSSACHKSASPSPGAPTTGEVTATLTPSPMAMQAQFVSGPSTVRFQMHGTIVFHDSTGVGGRVTQILVAFSDSQGAIASPVASPADITVPAGSTATYELAQTFDAPPGRTPTLLQMSASGADPTGKAFSVAPVQVALLLAAAPSTGPFSHVFVIVEENENHADVIGNAELPYLNGLARDYGLATQYYANTHPSIGNYFMLTVGNIVTNNDNYASIVSDDNIIRQLVASGKTWKSYAEGLPAVGYTGGDTGLYVRRHNVIALLADVVSSPAQSARLVPFSQFATDLAAGALPNYAFIVPNLCSDGHSCPQSAADAWLRSNIAPLVNSADFQQSGLLIIVYDEASDSDLTHGGGRVAWVAVSGRSKRGYQSSTFYQHESTLRLTAQALGLSVYPNRGASAPDMSEFFTF